MINDCPFCAPVPPSVFHQGRLVRGLWDGFAVSDGHALLVTKRHCRTWFDATDEERLELTQAIEVARWFIVRAHPEVRDFNIGINVGVAAGQSVDHLHVHVIPRRLGDVPDARGGVRNVIPSKRLYGAMLQPVQLLSTGGEQPLWPLLTHELERASLVEIAVAFVMASGVARVMPYFEGLLARGGELRLLTGDYLDLTDPDALRRLLDLKLEYPEGKVELRVFISAGRSFHPKAYILTDSSGGQGAAFVGSSNMSASALLEGVEWNYRVVPARDAEGFRQVRAAFSELFKHRSTRVIDEQWVAEYQARRQSRPFELPMAADDANEPYVPPPEPHAIQQEALARLELTRQQGYRAGLVVMATGLGKTWLAAFDTARFAKVLFVAHREEILTQALQTFRRVRPSSRFGRFSGDEKVRGADVTFASVQTLGRPRHLEKFARDEFDYIVIDEFHHASAQTYRRIIEHFEPKFLLGLTATPERSDGGDLLSLCAENLVYRCDLTDGIRAELLSPFRYFGVPDTIDYENIPWRSTHFDETALTNAAATETRALNALTQWRTRGGQRTLAFCVSQRHADFMRAFFRAQNVPCAAVHSGATSDPRETSLEQLAEGRLKVVFSVDMFNEGVDVPAVDTVMMLRPTESSIIWLQQFGRGLRRYEGKTLTVIDYIGNHRSFLLKARTLLDVAPGSDARLNEALQRAVNGELTLPPGCSVTYDLKAVDIMRALMRLPREGVKDALREYYADFRERRGTRPTALEAFHDGYNPRAPAGSWFGLVEEMGDLTAGQRSVLAGSRSFLEALARTEMTRSFKMVLLQSLLNRDALPGDGLLISDLASEFRAIVERDPRLRQDVGGALESAVALRNMLQRNPIEAWVGGKGTDGAFFSFEGGRFKYLEKPPVRAAFQELVRELVDWRLAEYLVRQRAQAAEFVLKVSHAGKRPIVFLDRDRNSGLPEGATKVHVGAEVLEANFAKVALNVVRTPGKDDNELPRILRGWFGHDAGLPGTSHRVVLARDAEDWVLSPLARSTEDAAIELWRPYMREQIPAFFGATFSEATWNVGFVPHPTSSPKDLVLLVTLQKDDMHGNFDYGDRFISPSEFEWQSQKRTRAKDKRGTLIREHAKKGVAVHLFVRRSKKDGKGNSSPFIYCGKLTYLSSKGEQPMTVRWKMEHALPARVEAALLPTLTRR
jgi:superfamily II DNA or RNA helicase/diadenosine tetraphosphate (Ap4A) HIT family hydrolase